jgi:hypothetical protein
MASLKEQPPNKPITLEKLLSEEDGIPNRPWRIVQPNCKGLNNVSLEETAFLSEPSDAKSQTKPSQSSDSAKSSAGHHANCEGNQPKQCNSSLSSSTS